MLLNEYNTVMLMDTEFSKFDPEESRAVLVIFLMLHIRIICCQAVVVHFFNPTSWEAEAGGSLSSRPAWFIECVDRHREDNSYTEKTLCQCTPPFFKAVISHFWVCNLCCPL